MIKQGKFEVAREAAQGRIQKHMKAIADILYCENVVLNRGHFEIEDASDMIDQLQLDDQILEYTLDKAGIIELE